MSAGSARRAGQKPPQSPDERVQQRLRAAEGAQAPWRGVQAGSNRPERIVRGGVASNGAIQVGDGGFTASRTGVGRYTVTYTDAFASTANPVCTLHGDGSAAITDIIEISSYSNTGFNVAVNWPNDGSARDRAFSFIVVGPQS